MTIDEKAAAYGPLTVYRAIPACVDAVLMDSPASGRTYRIEVSGRCGCPCKGICWHIRALELQYGSVDAAIADLTRTELPAFLAAMEAAKPAPVRPVISAKTRDLDFG